MRLYLCGRPIDETMFLFEAAARGIAARGHICTSRWINTSKPDRKLSPEEKCDAAMIDLADIYSSDALISVSSDLSGPGGRHVELGVALALEIPIYIIGNRENIFHYLDEVEVFATLEDLLNHLGS